MYYEQHLRQVLRFLITRLNDRLGGYIVYVIDVGNCSVELGNFEEFMSENSSWRAYFLLRFY